MPKPRKGTSEVFYDTFADFPVEEQAIALRIMTEIHRQAVKAQKRNSQASPIDIGGTPTETSINKMDHDDGIPF
jgi:hypothetical protein